MTLFALIVLLALLNPLWTKGQNLIHVSQSLCLLRTKTFEHFSFGRWQSIVTMTALGLLASFEPSTLQSPPPQGLLMILGVLSTWASFFVSLGILSWWMQRGKRWNGEGDLFNLIAAAWFLPATIASCLSVAGVSPLFLIPLAFYAMWVGAKALSGAMPNASLRYILVGLLIDLVPSTLAGALTIMIGTWITLALGWVSR